MITVVCEDSAHEGKRAVVARFETRRVLDDDTGEWGPAEWRTSGHRHRGSPRPTPRQQANSRTSRIASGGAPITLRSEDQAVDHEKIELRCPLCGLDVQARKVRLDVVLDRLAEARAPSITLTALGAILQRSARKRP